MPAEDKAEDKQILVSEKELKSYIEGTQRLQGYLESITTEIERLESREHLHRLLKRAGSLSAALSKAKSYLKG